ncbi:unnamed protein product, partial [Polarella glacialis]
PKLTHYSVLNVPRHSSSEEISRAYRALSKLCHPDRATQTDASSQRARERRMAQINEAHDVLTSPRQRWSYDRSLGPEPADEEAAAAAAAAAAIVSAPPFRPPPRASPASSEADFDFSGDGRPFRCSMGKAARAAKACGSRDGARVAMQQLCGKQVMDLADCNGVVRHVGPLSPFAGLGECGHPSCRAHRLQTPE